MSPWPLDIPVSAGKAGGDTDGELQSGICIYLIAERPEGATIRDLADLRLGGLSPTVEIIRVSEAVSVLVDAGLVKMEGSKVCPVAPE